MRAMCLGGRISILRRHPRDGGGVTADWMAQQWRDKKRIKKKLGSYPAMSLSQAREVFNRDFADMIEKGRSIKIAGDTRPGTVADLLGLMRSELIPVARSTALNNATGHVTRDGRKCPRLRDGPSLTRPIQCRPICRATAWGRGR